MNLPIRRSIRLHTRVHFSRFIAAFPAVSGLAAAAWLVAGCGSFETVENAQGRYTGKGDAYYLPKTALLIKVPMSMSVTEPGELARFGPALIGVPEASEKATHAFKIDQSAITTDLLGLRDEELEIVIRDRKNSFVTRSRTLEWNDEGVLSSGEASAHDRTVEVVVKTIEEVAKTVAAGAKFASQGEYLLGTRRGLPKLMEYLNYAGATPPAGFTPLDEGALRAGLDRLLDPTMTVPTPVQGALPPGSKSTFTAHKRWLKYAEHGGERYFKLVAAAKDARKLNLLMSDFTGQSAEVIAAKEKTAQEILNQFTTVTTTTSWTATFRYIPRRRPAAITAGALPAECVELVSYTAAGGLQRLDESCTQQAPAGLKYKDGPTQPQRTVQLALASQAPKNTAQWEQRRRKGGARGWHYIIPAKSRLLLTVAGRIVDDRTIQIAQHGVLASGPATTGGAKVLSKMQLDPATGARRSSTFGGESYDPALVGQLGNAAQTIVTAETERDIAQQALGSPELRRLQARKQMLQLRKDIADLEKSLGQ